MLFVQEEKAKVRVDENAWSDTDSESVNSDPETYRACSVELSRDYDRSQITVLDRLHDGGANLTHLAILFISETNWVCQGVPVSPITD
jgi:hypothetical protein